MRCARRGAPSGTRSTGTPPIGTPTSSRSAPNRCTARSSPVVLLEGAYSARPELHDLLDLRVLLDTPTEVRLRRLLAREGESYRADWLARWSGAEDHYFGTVMPIERFDLVLTPCEGRRRGGYVRVMTDRTTSDRPIRWGIASTGTIAASMTQALQTLGEGPNGAEVVAVGSRAQRLGRRVRPTVRDSAGSRNLRRPVRRSRRRHGLHRVAPHEPLRDDGRRLAGRQARALREAGRRQRRRGAHDGRHCTTRGALPDGGDVDVVHPRDRRHQAAHRGGRDRSADGHRVGFRHHRGRRGRPAPTDRPGRWRPARSRDLPDLARPFPHRQPGGHVDRRPSARPARPERRRQHPGRRAPDRRRRDVRVPHVARRHLHPAGHDHRERGSDRHRSAVLVQRGASPSTATANRASTSRCRTRGWPTRPPMPWSACAVATSRAT